MKRGIVLAMLLIPTSAFAQQPDPKAEIQALSQRLSRELSLGIACDATVINLRQQLTQTQNEIKRLSDKKQNSGSK